jgi:hypothetical protein
MTVTKEAFSMLQLRVARHMLVALVSLTTLAPAVFADNSVNSARNADGSTTWNVVDDQSLQDGGVKAPAGAIAPMTVAPAASSKRAYRSSAGGGVTVKKNRDGSVEAYCSGPSGVLPPAGYSGDWSGGSGGGGYSSSGGDGVTMTRNADGSIETSSAGPGGSWGGGGGRTARKRTARKPVHHPVGARATAGAIKKKGK